MAVSADAVGGTPMTGQAYMNVKGSPYLYEDWEKGDVTLASGRKFESIDLMYDLIANQVIFKDSDGESKLFSQPIKTFNIVKSSEIHSFERGMDGAFYEKLVTGNTTLWKRIAKSIIDEKPYGSATLQRNILTNIYYYTGEIAQPVKFKTDKKSVLALLINKNNELEEFIKNDKINTRNEVDLIRLFQYYNSL